MGSRKQEHVKVSIVAFVKEKERKRCAVCGLPEAVRQQIQVAREKGYKISEQVEYLRAIGYPKVGRQELLSHANRRHDDDA